MKVKLCGFKDQDSLDLLAELKVLPDFVGFIFHPQSSRYISPESAAKISSQVSSKIAKVAVVVNPNIDTLKKIATNLRPQYFQFHGDESAEFLNFVKKNFSTIRIIKAFRIQKKTDLDLIKNYQSVADLFLFDSGSGGSGIAFDWEILQGLKTDKEWFLSGGLTPNNVAGAIKITKAKMVDVSSGFEEIKGGIKSLSLMRDFISRAHAADVS